MTKIEINQLFPESRLLAIRKAFQTTFESDQPQQVELLTGGLSTSLLYKVVVKDKNYVLRVIMHIDELNNPSRQFNCMRIAADQGIAPYVYYTNDMDAISITEFIEAIPLRTGFKSPEKLLRILAGTMQSIHQLPIFPSLIRFLDGVDIFIDQFKGLDMFQTNVYADCFNYYEEIQKVYPRDDANLVSSHNDPNPNNLLFDGKKIWVIDWETAFRNDEYVDLAIIAKSFVHNHGQEEFFLKTYFGGELDDYKRARFF